MNIEQANTIPMSEFLKKLNILPYRDYQCSALYKAPHRIEKTASFRVSKTKNVWFDHGTGKGGNFFSFVIEYLKSHKEDCTPSDALRFINNIWDNAPVPPLNELNKINESEENKLKLLSVSPLNHTALIRYIEDRGISRELAELYFKQALVRNENTGKTFNSIALQNEAGGYELKNKLFKGSVGSKDITLVRGTDQNQSIVHVFEGMFDFVSALIMLRLTRFKQDAIILNSLSCLKKSYPYIANYSYKQVYSWFDNDTAGVEHRTILNDFVKSQQGISHVSLHKKYNDHKDVNAWLVSQTIPRL